MRNTLFLLLALLAWQNSHATGQTSEIIIIDGEEFEMLSLPIYADEELVEAINSQKNPWHTACWRAYVGEWEIKDNILYLNNLLNCDRKENIEIPSVFDKYKEEGRIKASWYSGEIRVVEGEMIFYAHHSFTRYYEYETIYILQNGIIIEKKEYKNLAVNNPNKGQTMDIDMWNECFITAGSHFDWEKFPELPNRIVFSNRIKISDDGKLSSESSFTMHTRKEDESIRIENQQHPYIQEWIRCLNIVTAWPYMIVHDKIFALPYYTMPLIRKKPD